MLHNLIVLVEFNNVRPNLVEEISRFDVGLTALEPICKVDQNEIGWIKFWSSFFLLAFYIIMIIAFEIF